MSVTRSPLWRLVTVVTLTLALARALFRGQIAERATPLVDATVFILFIVFLATSALEYYRARSH